MKERDIPNHGYDKESWEEFKASIKDKKDMTEEEKRQKYLDFLELKGKLKPGFDKEKFKKQSSNFGSGFFSDDTPEGWEEAYSKHMEEKIKKYGSPKHSIKPTGKKRWF